MAQRVLLPECKLVLVLDLSLYPSGSIGKPVAVEDWDFLCLLVLDSFLLAVLEELVVLEVQVMLGVLVELIGNP